MNAPAFITAAFDAHPAATLVCEEHGHAYGHSRYRTRCKLTGNTINIGDTIRKVIVWTRSGHRFEGFITNKTFGLLFNFQGEWRWNNGSDFKDLLLSRTSKCRGEWYVDALDSLEAGDKLVIATPTMCEDYDETIIGLGTDGRFHRAGGSYKGQSRAQVLAGLRRKSRAVTFRIDRALR